MKIEYKNRPILIVGTEEDDSYDIEQKYHLKQSVIKSGFTDCDVILIHKEDNKKYKITIDDETI